MYRLDVEKLRGENEPPPLRQLTPAERKTFARRFGRHLPLLDGTRGHVLIGRDGELRTASLWRGEVFVIGYVWQRGRIREASLVLPMNATTVYVNHGYAA